MKKFLKWLGGFIIILAAAGTLFLLAMQSHDGPLGMVSGGAFETGESSSAPADWSYLKERALLEFQTLEPESSRTVWLGVHEGRLFVVSGYMNTGFGKIWKQWPHYLENDDRVILRIDGKLYEQKLERVMEGPNVKPVLDEFNRKYGLGAEDADAAVRNGDVWLFEVVNR